MAAATGYRLSRGGAVLRGLALPLAAGLALAAALAAGGEAGLALPAAVAAAAAAAALGIAALRGAPWAVAVLVAVTVIGLHINFRSRDVGEIGLDWQNGAKLAVWLALAGIAAANRRRLVPLLRDRAYALAWVYMAVALASTAWSGAPAYTAANAVGMAAYLALAGLVAVRLGDAAGLRVLTASLAVFVAVGLAGGLLAPDLAWQPPSEEETVYRFRGFSGHANVLGQQAASLCLLALAARRAGVVGRGAFLTAFGLGLAAALASRSRFALAALLVSWAFVALRGRVPGRVLAVAAAGLAGLAAIGIACLAVAPPPDLDAQFGNLSRTGSATEILTLTGRTELWSAALDLIARKPLFGWGFNATEGLLVDLLPRGFYGSGLNPHNMTLQTLMSLGLVGSLPAFALFALLLARMAAEPDPVRDQVTLFVMLNGFGEIEVYGTPVILNLIFYWALARAAARGRARSA